MKKMISIFLLAIFTLTPTASFAIQKIFYDSFEDRMIVDISGKKTIEQVVLDSNLEDASYIQEVTIDESQEGARVDENGKLVKYNYLQEDRQKLEAKKAEKLKKESALKKRLGLSDAEWEDLKETLK